MARERALVTGASAGLGALFAERLAARGHDLVLVARRAERLAAIKVDLEARFSVAVEAIDADLTAPGGVAALVMELEEAGLAIDLLVNNAGFGLRGAFAELDGPSQARMIALNCSVPMELAHALVGPMIARGRGGILNVASTAAFQPGPWMAVYYATKAFLLSFSEALHHELRGTGVAVSALCPGPTRTEFFETADMGDSMLAQRLAGDPAKVVDDGLAALQGNRALVVSGALNKTLAASMRVTPRPVARAVAGALQRRRAR